MGKKKKNKNSPSKSNSPFTPANRKGFNDNNDCEQNQHGESSSAACSSDIMKKKSMVLTIQNNGNNANKAKGLKEENERVLYINEYDASCINVSTGDKVLVVEVKMPLHEDISNDNNDISIPNQIVFSEEGNSIQQPKFVSVCKIKIGRNVSKKGSFSPKSPSNINNKSNVSQGEVKVYPTLLSQQIFKEKEDLDSSSQDNKVLQLNSPSQYNTNTPKTANESGNFSFKSFVKSPSSESKKSSSKTKEKRFAKLAVLPLKHIQDLSKRLLVSHSILHLKLITNQKTQSFFHVLERSKMLLQRMILSVCDDQYLRHKDIISITFQGIKVQFEVFVPNEQNQSNNWSDVDGLDSTMKQLSLDAEEKFDNDDDVVSHTLTSQFSSYDSKGMLLYVCRDTKIQFAFDDKSNQSINNIDTQGKISSINNMASMSSKKIVAGLDSILEQIHIFFKSPLQHPEMFPKTGPIRAPKGLLLHGSSGCGKTLIAKQIEFDIMNKTYLDSEKSQRPVIGITYINCASIQATTSIIGEAEHKLTKIFEKAEQRTNDGFSTLIILDDVHLICSRRGAAGGNGTDRIASTLLALMDGIGQHSSDLNPNPTVVNIGNVAILAITTNPTLLDPALRRAGRLDNEIEIPNPDDNTRAEIFNLLLTELEGDKVSIPQLGSDSIMKYAKLAKGFTGGDCCLSVKEAIRQALFRFSEAKDSKILLLDTDIQQAIRNTKPSAIKSITVEIPHVPWSSIGGMDNVKNLLREAIELPMTHSHLFEALRIPPPRGVLLYGPPGCSKTLMARALATEGNMNFLTVKGPELLSKWLGESERQLASLFRRARLASPCVIFFDELDAIASKRGSSGSSGGDRMLSQLLTELDGITMTSSVMNSSSEKKAKPRVVVVGATNRPDLLDSALTRPGRIDRMIYVGLPDQASREAIFKLQFDGRSCDPSLDTAQLATHGDGFSGAEIVSICREAALYAIEEIDKSGTNEDPIIQMHHVMHSLVKAKRQITPQMLDFYAAFGSRT